MDELLSFIYRPSPAWLSRARQQTRGVNGCSLALMKMDVSDPASVVDRADQFDHGTRGQSNATDDPSLQEPA
jgi:hypothetical protein